MAAKTVIGVIPLYDDEKESIWMLPGYMDGISEAGGIPVILPLKMNEEDFEKIDSFCDGYLFTGGHDIHPRIYGEENRGKCGVFNGERDKIEGMIFKRAYEQDKPVLGICRGLQMINALMGGTLYQDIPEELSTSTKHHMKPPYDREAHKAKVVKNSSLYSLSGNETISVNSYHHQAIKKLADGLEVMAVSEDGIIEAFEDKSRKFLWAFQWHPEFLYKTDECSRKIFKTFIEACKRK